MRYSVSRCLSKRHQWGRYPIPYSLDRTDRLTTSSTPPVSEVFGRSALTSGTKLTIRDDARSQERGRKAPLRRPPAEDQKGTRTPHIAPMTARKHDAGARTHSLDPPQHPPF